MTSTTQDFTDHYVQVGSLKMHYLDWGNHGAPQMLLLHGGSQSAHSWDEFSRNMRSDFHVIALDQRGHGDTDWSPRCIYTLRAHLRDITSFVKLVGLKQFVLVGLSMGGMNSYAYTAIHPQEVSRLVIVDVGPDMMKKGGDAIRRFTKVQRLPSFEAFVERSLKYNPLRTEEQIRDRLSHHLREYPGGNWGWKWDHRRFGKQVGPRRRARPRRHVRRHPRHRRERRPHRRRRQPPGLLRRRQKLAPRHRRLARLGAWANARRG